MPYAIDIPWWVQLFGVLPFLYVTAPRTWIPGELVTSSMMNTLRDLFLEVEAGTAQLTKATLVGDTTANLASLVSDTGELALAFDTDLDKLVMSLEGGAFTPVATQTMERLHTGDFTSTNTSATDVDSFAIASGRLAAVDTLVFYYLLTTTTQNTTAPIIIRCATDGVQLADLTDSGGGNFLTAHVAAIGKVTAMMRRGSSTVGNEWVNGFKQSGAGINLVGAFTLTTAITGARTVALRHSGVVLGGTFAGRWSAYVIKGS